MILTISVISLVVFLFVAAASRGDVLISMTKSFLFGFLYDKDDSEPDVTFYTFQASILCLLLTVSWERYAE